MNNNPQCHKTVEERFWEKVTFEPNSGCWLWLGAIVTGEYGKIKINMKDYLAHRFAYTHFVGPIPAGLTIDHLCRVRCCVNPNHLEAVSFEENMRRTRQIKRRERRTHRSYCSRGHKLETENTYVSPRGYTICRACNRMTKQKRKAIRAFLDARK